MNILFVHQNFPGQYLHIIRALAGQGGHNLVALGVNACQERLPQGVTYLRYPLQRANTPAIHPLALDFESKLIRAEACGSAAQQLREQGFQPDLICAHPGWGEALFLRDVWPEAPLLCYQEFFYQPSGLDIDFDPELQTFKHTPDWQICARTRIKNTHLLHSFEAANWHVSPTEFQRNTFPCHHQKHISVIHDGVDTSAAAPDANVPPLKLNDGTRLERGEAILTFVNRSLEPYRGCHTMIRAIPELQRLVPDVRVVLIGATTGVSYGKPCPQGEWKDQFLAEIEGHYDASRVHFCGPLPYKQFLHLLKLSACHVYLTYPFVLSWSLLEAMSSGCAVVGSATAPVQEVIQDGHNGLLVDFFSPGDLAAAAAELLSNRLQAQQLGQAARSTVLKRYDLSRCLPRHLSLMDLVANGGLGR